LLTEHFFDAPV